MIQVIDGRIVAYNLPKIGKLTSGETVSGYHLLPKETLYREEWYDEVKEPPSYNEETEQLIIKDHTFIRERKARSAFEDNELEITSVELAKKTTCVNKEINEYKQRITSLEERLVSSEDADEKELINKDLTWYSEVVLKKEQKLAELEEKKTITTYTAVANYKVETIPRPELSEADKLKNRLNDTEEMLIGLMMEGGA